MALLFLLILTASVWSLGAVQLTPRTRRIGDVPLWLGGALALGGAACIAWGFIGVFRYSDWQAASMGHAVRWLFGAGTLWFHRSGWPLLDGVANAYLTQDLLWTLAILCAAVLHGYVFWAGVAERRRQARARRPH